MRTQGIRAAALALVIAGVVPSPELAIADGPVAHESSGLAISRYFEDHARSLPPTTPSLSLEFPVAYVQRMLWDVGYVLTSPGRWDGEDWTGFGVVAAGTGALFAADRSIDVVSRRDFHLRSTEDSFMDTIQEFGSLGGIVGVVAGSELIGFATGDDELKSLGTDALESVAISGLLTASLKELAGRERPIRGDGPFAFKPFSGSASFPSGHTTAAFALAATVSEHYDNSLWVAIPAYALATGVGLARTRESAHFASDVFLGAAIGTASARTLVDLELDRRHAPAGSSGSAAISLAPTMVAGAPGVALRVRF